MASHNDGSDVLLRIVGVLHETEKATLVSFETGHQQWIPKSVLTHVDDDEREAWVKMWWADRQCLSYE